MEIKDKFCKKCDKNHPLDKDYWYFYKRPNGSDGFQCKESKKKSNNQYNDANKEDLLKKQRKSYHDNPDKARNKREKMSEYNKEYQKSYRKDNAGKLKALNKEWRESNKEYIKKKNREYYNNNIDKISESKRKWGAANKQKTRDKAKKKYQTVAEYKIRSLLRNRTRIAVGRHYHSGSAVKDLGLSISEFKLYLESKFYDHPVTGEAMSWDNQGVHGWHMDHITPLSSIDVTDPEALKPILHYTNIQPMWASENLRKGAKVPVNIDLFRWLSDRFSNIIALGDNKCSVGDLIVNIIPLEPSSEIVGSGLFFFASEINNKGLIVKSMISHRISESFSIGARKLSIGIPKSKEAREFMSSNHLMGPIVSAKHVGLYSGDEVVAILSYKRTKDGGIDISRFATERGLSVPGGFTRLVSYISKNNKDIKYIQSFCDNRYSDGNSYLKNGFIEVSNSASFVWSDGYSIFNRRACTANMDSRMISEKEHAIELGWFKIADCGQKKFLKKDLKFSDK